MASSPDAFHSVYANVGVGSTSSDPDGAHPVFVNVGVPPGTESNDGVHYVFLGNVDTGVGDPMIFFLRPTSARPLDGVDVFGHGFGASQVALTGKVEVYLDGAWEEVSATTWTRNAPTDSGSTRRIDPAAGEVTLEHEVISITVPADAIPPGLPVRVSTNA